MKRARASFSLLLAFGLLLDNSLAASRARVTLKVMDDEGNAVPRFPVIAGFDGGDEFRGQTDTNGLFIMEGDAGLGGVRFVFNETGYYYGQGVYSLRGGLKDGRQEPWDPVVTTVVRRIVNPIPMYAKCEQTTIPRTNEFLGFDLMVGDWVSPLGKGLVSDVTYRVSGYWRTYRDYDSILELDFPKAHDGLRECRYEVANGKPMGSQFCLPREAHPDGYVAHKKWHKVRRPAGASGAGVQSNDWCEGVGYVFRIRSETNQAGILTKAYYGKISRDLECGGASAQGSFLKFTYYLNPTPNDRNLEFDPKQNLFKNLGDFEEVFDP